MPLDKMPDSEKFVQTHKSAVLHIKEEPVACIIEENKNYFSYYENLRLSDSVKVSLIGFLNKHDDLGLLMGYKLKIQQDDYKIIEFTSYPNEEFIDAVILNETVFIISKKLDVLFSMKILTDQFVKTKIEFEKFKKLL